VSSDLPFSAVNARILIGGGVLGLVVISEAAFAFGANLV
jgi:hypothetical protein